MKEDSRIKKSARNMASGIVYRLLTTITAFVVRTVFIQCLNTEYLGVNGLYSSILSMLSLAELGFGTAMVYSMYHPLANRDYTKLAQLMQLYKHVYRIIGTVVLTVGLCLIPFLDSFIKDRPNIPGLTVYYLLFLGDSVLSYWFFAYRTSVLQADQKAYLISNYSSLFNLIKSAVQIIGLLIFRNFTIYLLIQIVCTVIQNIVIAFVVEKEYPIFYNKNLDKLDVQEKKQIFQNVKALMLQRVSFKVLSSSDSIIISAFLGVNWVGLLSNYIMIEQAVVSVLSQITAAISASLGNFFAKEDAVSGYTLFRRVEFMNCWMYGFCSVALIALLNPFIALWLGTEYLLDMQVVIALVVRFFVEGYMSMMSTFRSTLGLFTQGQYLPVLVAFANIVISIAFSFWFGVAGVLFATAFTRLAINAWYTPLIIHREGFHTSVRPFYIAYLKRVVILICIAIVMSKVSGIILSGEITIVRFFVLAIVTLLLPNSILAIVYHRTDEFQYFWQLGKHFWKERL